MTHAAQHLAKVDDMPVETFASGGSKRTLAEALAELAARQEQRTSRERHGEGELIKYSGVPTHALGCLLPDGGLTAATCLTRHDELADEDRVWTRPVVPGSPRRRRGRLRVEPGVALHFHDEGEADIPRAPRRTVADLAGDMAMSERMRTLVRDSDLFAALLYAALCNRIWIHEATGQEWSVSWRSAGSVVAHLRGSGDYLDWYCGGEEGKLDEQAVAELQALGWSPVEAAEPAKPEVLAQFGHAESS